MRDLYSSEVYEMGRCRDLESAAHGSMLRMYKSISFDAI